MKIDISAKAFGILIAILQHDLEITIESLVNHFNGEKRTAIQSGLRELKDHKYLKTKTYKMNRNPIQITTVTPKAQELLFGLGLISCNAENLHASAVNKHISRNTISTVISKKQTLTESKVELEREEFEVKNMAGWDGMFAPTSGGDDHQQEKAEQKKKRKDKQTKDRVERAKTRSEKRSKRNASEWNIYEVCYEFADRINSYWNIKPWEVTQSRFSFALGQFRNKHNTTGDVELAAMDIFFRQIDIKEYNDAETLWKAFIHRLPGLIGQAKLSMHTEESDAVAKEAFELAMKRLRGE